MFRIIINPDKIPYNLSEVILWTLDNGNTIKTMQVTTDIKGYTIKS